MFIDPEKVLQIGTKSEKKLRSRLRLSSAIEGEGFSESESDQEDDAAERNADEERQKKLIQEAFAGDDVVEDFIKEQKVNKGISFELQAFLEKNLACISRHLFFYVCCSA